MIGLTIDEKYSAVDFLLIGMKELVHRFRKKWENSPFFLEKDQIISFERHRDSLP